MSRSQLSRTPENFPRMKHRAAGRLARKQVTAIQSLPEVMKAVGQFLERFIDALIAVGEGLAKAFQPPPTQRDYALVPAPAVFRDGLIPHPTIEGLRYDPAIVCIPTGYPVVDSAHRLTRATETYSLPQAHFLGGKP